MILYEIIGRFYDDVMGDQQESALQVRKLIEKYNPGAESVLELACGTGSFLYHLSKYYNTTAGLDLSSIMLSIARNKLPDIPLYQCDMTDFHFYDKFDVVICMNDSINHLIDFTDWEKMFGNVYNHLNPGGIFIFDINTLHKLNTLADSPPSVHEFEKNLLITNVYRKDSDKYVWHLRVFEHKVDNKFVMHEEFLEERGFPVDMVKGSLSGKFKRVDISDLEKKRVTNRSNRLHIVAVKEQVNS